MLREHKAVKGMHLTVGQNKIDIPRNGGCAIVRGNGVHVHIENHGVSCVVLRTAITPASLAGELPHCTCALGIIDRRAADASDQVQRLAATARQLYRVSNHPGKTPSSLGVDLRSETDGHRRYQPSNR